MRCDFVGFSEDRSGSAGAGDHPLTKRVGSQSVGDTIDQNNLTLAPEVLSEVDMHESTFRMSV